MSEHKHAEDCIKIWWLAVYVVTVIIVGIVGGGIVFLLGDF